MRDGAPGCFVTRSSSIEFTPRRSAVRDCHRPPSCFALCASQDLLCRRSRGRMPSEALAEEGCHSAMNIECPASMRRHVQKVLGGEYDIPYRHSAPVILDIGANVGSGLGAQALARGDSPLLRTAPR